MISRRLSNLINKYDTKIILPKIYENLCEKSEGEGYVKIIYNPLLTTGWSMMQDNDFYFSHDRLVYKNIQQKLLYEKRLQVIVEENDVASNILDLMINKSSYL